MNTNCEFCIAVRNSKYRLVYYCKQRLNAGFFEKHWKCVGFKNKLCPQFNGKIENNETTMEI